MRPVLIILTILFVAAATFSALAEDQVAKSALSASCQLLDTKAEPNIRYLLCSDGLYDRKMKGLLIEIKNGNVSLPIAGFPNQGFKTGMIKIPDRYSGLAWITADGSKVLAWANEDGFLLFSHSIGDSRFQTYIVAPKLIDQAGLSIGSQAPKKGCQWGEGTLTCNLDYIKTNEPKENYALAEKNRIEAFVLTSKQDAKVPLAKLQAPQSQSQSSEPSDLPKNIGDCVMTTITTITDRFGSPLKMTDTGTSVLFSNRGHQISYERETAIARSRVGDKVRMCLVSIPKDCPPGDNRGRIYNSTNLRTGEAWSLPDSQHMCGGA